jgi:hypothetical protein
MLRLAEGPPHPDLLHSPSQTGVNALVASGEKEHASTRWDDAEPSSCSNQFRMKPC